MPSVLSRSGVVAPATISLFLLYSNELAGDFFFFFLVIFDDYFSIFSPSFCSLNL